jgi:hypothetical protein
MSILFLENFDQLSYENLHHLIIRIGLQKAKVDFATVIQSKNHGNPGGDAWALLGVLLSLGPPCSLKIVGGSHPTFIKVYHSKSALDIVKELL